tara:strand:- start:2334 stop:3326 length:993 start_codon:yes stop_codon:yes gene_type:complete
MTTTTQDLKDTIAEAITLGDVINDQPKETLRPATSENNDALQTASSLGKSLLAKLRRTFSTLQKLTDKGELSIVKKWLGLSKLYSGTFGTKGMDRKSSELIQSIYEEFDCDKTTETTFRYIGVLIAYGLDISNDKLMTINSQTGRVIPVSRSALTEFNKVIRNRKVLDKANKALTASNLNDMFEFYLEKGIGEFIKEYPRSGVSTRVSSSKKTDADNEENDALGDKLLLSAVITNSDEVEAEQLNISLDDATALLDGKDCNKPMTTEQSDGFNALLDAVTFRDVSNAFINKLDECTLQQRLQFYERFTERYAEDFIDVDMKITEETDSPK